MPPKKALKKQLEALQEKIPKAPRKKVSKKVPEPVPDPVEAEPEPEPKPKRKTKIVRVNKPKITVSPPTPPPSEEDKEDKEDKEEQPKRGRGRPKKEVVKKKTDRKCAPTFSLWRQCVAETGGYAGKIKKGTEAYDKAHELFERRKAEMAELAQIQRQADNIKPDYEDDVVSGNEAPTDDV